MDATKKITKNLGGDRLGSGAKNNISLHNYNRSTHNLSRAWRSSMTCGTLVPCFKELALNGDTWSIDLNTIVKTIPTIGPLYGSFKLQIDFFTAPIRLYNGLLHNNMTKIGMNMAAVKLPKMILTTNTKNPTVFDYNRDTEQINPSSLLRYLGLSGIGDADWTNINKEATTLERKFQCVPHLAYWDIYKNYYANKQEETGVVICPTIETVPTKLIKITSGANYNWDFEEPRPITPTDVGTVLGDQWYNLDENNLYHCIRLNENEDVIIYIKGDLINMGKMSVIFQDPTTNDTTAIDLKSVFPNARKIEDTIICGKPLAMYSWDVFQNYVIAVTMSHENNVYSSKPDLQVFTLDNIDKARIAILQNTGLGNELIINNDLAMMPYETLYVTDDEGYNLGRYALTGLGVKTYQSDLFNNWLQTEWIDGVNGINAITAIDVSSGSFTIDALNLANKVYNMLNRVAVSGGSYEDWQEAVYTTETNRRAETPVYKGGMSAEIMFGEVISTAETDDKALGTLAGRGFDQEKKGGHIEIWIDEPSYIIGLVSLTPRVDYSQGNDWDICELDTMDDLHKPALDGIGFEDLLQERMCYIGTYYDSINNKWTKLAAGKVPAWINYMTSVNKTYGDFADSNKNMFMTLNRKYEYPTPTLYSNGIKDLTTYIDPSKHNYAFASTELEAQNFWVQIGMAVEARRVMSAKIIPNL